MHDSASAQPSPFVEIDRRSWAALAPSTQLPLTEAELVQLRGLGDRLDTTEVSDVYLPLSRLINLYAGGARALHRSTSEFLHGTHAEHPVRDRCRRIGRRRQVHHRTPAARTAGPLG